MARQRTQEPTSHDGDHQCLKRPLRNLGVSCMLNTEVSAVLSAIHKILKLGVFDEKTPGAGDAVHAVVLGAAACRLERTDPAAEDAVLMRVLQVMATLLKHKAAVLLSDHDVCMLVNTCFQVVQQSSLRGHLLQRSARYAMHDLVQTREGGREGGREKERGREGGRESEGGGEGGMRERASEGVRETEGGRREREGY